MLLLKKSLVSCIVYLFEEKAGWIEDPLARS